MKKILFLLLISIATYGQARFPEGVRISGGQPTVTTTNFLTATDATGLQTKIAPVNLPFTNQKTIAQIRAFSGSISNVYTTDLGQEGNWYYDASDTTSSDNTGTILVTADGKRIKRVYSAYVNVKWFGVKGDGTNETTGIQNAIDKTAAIGGKATLYFPKGVYGATHIVLSCNMEGYNQRSSILLCLDSASGSFIDYKNVLSYFNMNNLGLKYEGTQLKNGLNFTWQSSIFTTAGLWYSSFKNLYIEGFTGHGLILFASDYYLSPTLTQDTANQFLSFDTVEIRKGGSFGVDSSCMKVVGQLNTAMFSNCGFYMGAGVAHPATVDDTNVLIRFEGIPNRGVNFTDAPDANFVNCTIQGTSYQTGVSTTQFTTIGFDYCKFENLSRVVYNGYASSVTITNGFILNGGYNVLSAFYCGAASRLNVNSYITGGSTTKVTNDETAREITVNSTGLENTLAYTITGEAIFYSGGTVNIPLKTESVSIYNNTPIINDFTTFLKAGSVFSVKILDHASATGKLVMFAGAKFNNVAFVKATDALVVERLHTGNYSIIGYGEPSCTTANLPDFTTAAYLPYKTNFIGFKVYNTTTKRYNVFDGNNWIDQPDINLLNLKENASNKSDSFTVSSSTTYASTKALVDGLSSVSVVKPFIYKAIITQTGTSDPVATVIYSNYVGSIVWTRTGVGNYRATLTGAFPAAKTFVMTGTPTNGTNYSIGVLRGSDDYIFMDSFTNGVLTDGTINNQTVSFEVYP